MLVAAAGQDDRVVNSTALSSSLYRGSGNDTLVGGPASDLLNGGGGADVLDGPEGNDLLRAHDLADDRRIDCGKGSDKADLDLLPADSAVNGCEAATRH
jgi:Ca2+-binding RTX toxin-like protein